MLFLPLQVLKIQQLSTSLIKTVKNGINNWSENPFVVLGPWWLLWRHDNDGSNSVKSVYHNIMNDIYILDTEHLKIDGNWLDIWKLQVSPEIKHFVWRVLRCCLPTRERLQQKGIHCPPGCVFCPNEIESSWHIFISCLKAKQVWVWYRFYLLIRLFVHLLAFLLLTFSSSKSRVCMNVD